MIMQYISEVLASIALLISAFSFLESRRNNRVGHAPALLSNETETPTGYTYSIQNKGRGPAYFEKIEYFIDKQPLGDRSLREVIAKVLTENGVRCELSVTRPAQQNVMQASEQIVLVAVSVRPEDSAKLKAISADRFGVRITFRSAHGKRIVWASDDHLLSDGD
jgi:hypothetical protein